MCCNTIALKMVQPQQSINHSVAALYSLTTMKRDAYVWSTVWNPQGPQSSHEATIAPRGEVEPDAVLAAKTWIHVSKAEPHELNV